MTIKELINQGIIMLKNEGIESPIAKAREILAFTLKTSKQHLLIYDNKEVTKSKQEEYIKNIKRLLQGEPLQYIIGTQEFMKLKFVVTKDVLIPQPDTEILVEETIKILENVSNPVVLDLCTGSGAIAISIAKYVQNVQIYATDISKKALEIAKQNATLNGVSNNIKFIESNLFEKIKDEKFDVIESNPPYIPTEDIKKLSKEVQNEPKIALDGGKDGLDFYRKIVKEGNKYLNRQGYLCLEIGYDQKNQVKKIIDDERRYVETYCKKDLCQNDRIIVTRIG